MWQLALWALCLMLTYCPGVARGNHHRDNPSNVGPQLGAKSSGPTYGPTAAGPHPGPYACPQLWAQMWAHSCGPTAVGLPLWARRCGPARACKWAHGCGTSRAHMWADRCGPTAVSPYVGPQAVAAHTSAALCVCGGAPLRWCHGCLGIVGVWPSYIGPG